jgi:hypothetical protein
MCLYLVACGSGSEPLSPASSGPTRDLPDAEETRAIARNAYIYGFPMVMNYKTLYQYAVDTESPDYKWPLNQR